jgi:DNA invertase Pin-like site-specific DNA recombinase
MLAFAEFERDMIVERTLEGREIARQNPNYRDGRKKKYTPQQMEHALAMLKKNSYNQVAAMTGISKSTLIRANKEKLTLPLGNPLRCVYKQEGGSENGEENDIW